MVLIHIKRFDKIEEIDDIDILRYSKDNPVINEEHEFPVYEIFKKEGDMSQTLINSELKHWENLLRNRLVEVNFDFAYTMYYFERGIPDEEWFIPPVLEGEPVQMFPHFKEEHYTNYANFCYFVDNFYLKAFTVYETIGHLLYKQFDLPLNEDDWRDQISFNSAIFKLKGINPPLHKDLKQIKNSPDFSKGIKMRNDIAHNHPPYQQHTTSLGPGSYTPSNEIKKTMIGLLASINQTFEVLKKHLT